MLWKASPQVLIRYRIPIIIILRLVYLRTALEAPDKTFNSVASSICTSCEICFCMVTACIPVTKPMLDGFASGKLGNSLRQDIPRNAQVVSYAMHTLRSALRPQHQKLNVSNESLEAPEPSIVPGHAVTSKSPEVMKRDAAERPSISSNRSNQKMIRRTDEWIVHYDNDPELSSESLRNLSQASRPSPWQHTC